MSTSRTVISPTWIAPVEPAGSLLQDHSLVIEDDTIVALEPAASARKNYPEADEITLHGHLLTPGFVNCHGHAAMTLLRGVADDREMMDWLTNWIWPIESELVDAQFVYDGTRLAVAEMLLSGTTCAADLYFFPEAAKRAFTEMQFRAQVGLPVLKFANAWANGEEDHIHKGLELRDSVRNSELITTAFAPHSPYTVTDSGFERIKLYSEQLDLPIHLHLHETATEVSDAVRDTGVRPIERLRGLGILGSLLQSVHMTQLREDEMELLVRYGVQVVHCPESNLKLASGICPVHSLNELEVNVALGTDGAASNNDLDMLQEARTASMLSKVISGDATSLSADTCLEMLTIRGARFLGLEEDIGSLVPGKRADMVAIDLTAPELQPVYNPVSQLIYAATGRDVSHVWVNGVQLVEQHTLTQADTSGILAATERWQRKVKDAV